MATENAKKPLLVRWLTHQIADIGVAWCSARCGGNSKPRLNLLGLGVSGVSYFLFSCTSSRFVLGTETGGWWNYRRRRQHLLLLGLTLMLMVIKRRKNKGDRPLASLSRNPGRLLALGGTSSNPGFPHGVCAPAVPGTHTRSLHGHNSEAVYTYRSSSTAQSHFCARAPPATYRSALCRHDGADSFSGAGGKLAANERAHSLFENVHVQR